MAQLIIRDVEKVLIDLLARRAVEHGRSVEAEHRELLREALQPQWVARRVVSLKDHLLAMPDVGDDTDFAIPRARTRRTRP